MAVKSEEIERRAADWAIALDRGLTSQEKVTLDQWVAADVRHEGALVRARAVWAAAIEAGPNVTRKAAGASVPRRKLVLGGAVAASLAAGGLGFLMLGGRTYRAGQGEIRRLAMEDGSQAVMNSTARMNVHFSSNRRSIELGHGEAWFEVAKDPQRPFVVSAGTMTVTAIGTAFTVRDEVDMTEVLVSEGVVLVRSGAHEPVTLSQGQSLRWPKGGQAQVARLEPKRLQRKLAWRDGLIMLDGERLEDAAGEFNRYSRRKIRVNPAIADRQVVGVFKAQDAEGFAEAIGLVLSTPVEVATDEIRIGFPESVTETS